MNNVWFSEKHSGVAVSGGLATRILEVLNVRPDVPELRPAEGSFSYFEGEVVLSYMAARVAAGRMRKRSRLATLGIQQARERDADAICDAVQDLVSAAVVVLEDPGKLTAQAADIYEAFSVQENMLAPAVRRVR